MKKKSFLKQAVYNLTAIICLLFFAGTVSAQNTQTISGVVFDEDGVTTVIGANVFVKGDNTSTGTITDIDGQFRLQVKTTDILVVSYIGYKTQEIPVKNNSNLRIVLTSDTEFLDEVVVVGFGKQKRINLTGAVEQVDEKIMANRPVANIGLALQGAVGNLNIAPNGGPGGTINYNVRGATSISGATSPLFVVDGIPVDVIDNINPADIKTVTVLKDAASAAIYGARAAYGVVLITTKEGKGKTKISYSALVGSSSAIQMPKMTNSLEFAEAYNIACLNAGQNPYFGEDHINRIKAYMADPKNTPSNVPNPSNPSQWSYATLANDNVDWYEAFFKSNTINQKHNVTISGGDEKTNYYVGVGYFKEGGLLRYGNENHERYNITANLHLTPLSWMRADLRTRLVRDDMGLPSSGHNNDIGNWWHQASTRWPNWSLKDPNGNWSQASNMPRQWEGRRNERTNQVNIMGALEIEPLKDWKINLELSYRNTAIRIADQIKPFAWQYTVSGDPVMNTTNWYEESMTQSDYYVANLYTSYQKQIKKHFFSATVGQQAELSEYKYLYGKALNLVALDLPSFGVAVGDQTTKGSLSHWATTGTFMRFSYNYDERYLIEFNGRYDGTSKFQRGKRFGFFPSISAGYNIAKEKFWPIKDISTFKLRGSYGSLGNQNVDNYLYLNKVNIGTKYSYLLNGELPNTLGAPGLVSANLTWEESRTLDFGLDVAMLNNRLNLSFDWYTRSTLGMFGPANAYPSVLGASVPKMNNADMRTNGFELSIGWRDRIGDEFLYNVNFILSDNQSKITKYNNPTKILSTYYEGQRIGEVWGYKTTGLIQTQDQLDNIPDQSYIYGQWSLGDVEYKDLNDDGKVNKGKNTLDDHGDLAIIGNTEARYRYSLNMGATWKGFDFNMFWQGVGKRNYVPAETGNGGVLFWGITGGYGQNIYKEHLDFWTPENSKAYYPKPYSNWEATKNHHTQSRYLQNAAYLRLKNIQLGYTISPTLTSKIGLSKVRVYLSGENLLTFSPIAENFDPEQTYGSYGAGKTYPYYKTISFGLNIDF
ncbi:TonB-dependent receptor [Bacteroides sp. 519]|uniref:SusC/RagA family TonB-linked outer membrane protein n=1 Tax=Bacteroides sp. 519 TaxID=2302937 RepID=UPI0013D19A13|nr:TonB-dependent receptor [Bacteroides sp. 519]NDV58264.1 TonB-dependent receptor [Bacteroides sp. 519]